MTIDNICALQKIKTLKIKACWLFLVDPPYTPGSTVKIGKNGKPYYAKAVDLKRKTK